MTISESFPIVCDLVGKDFAKSHCMNDCPAYVGLRGNVGRPANSPEPRDPSTVEVVCGLRLSMHREETSRAVDMCRNVSAHFGEQTPTCDPFTEAKNL